MIRTPYTGKMGENGHAATGSDARCVKWARGDWREGNAIEHVRHTEL